MDYYTGVEAIGTQRPVEAPLKVEPISRDDFHVLTSDRKRNTVQCHLPPVAIDFSPMKDSFSKRLQEINDEHKRNEARIAEFKTRWNESSKSLTNTPLMPLMSQLGEQLAAGKLNPEALQKALDKVKFAEEDLPKMHRAMQQFREDMTELFGLDVNPLFRGKGDEISVTGLIITEANGDFANNAQIHIDKTEAPQSKVVFRRGITGPIVTEISVDGAMTKLHEHVKAGRRK